jgi:hypothetical protein
LRRVVYVAVEFDTPRNAAGVREERMDEEKKRESEKYVNKWHVEIIPLG